VRDNRIGIPPKKDRLKPTGEGTGLGLSISYEIVTHADNGQKVRSLTAEEAVPGAA
jgi:signal transduction histidine kinase